MPRCRVFKKLGTPSPRGSDSQRSSEIGAVSGRSFLACRDKLQAMEEVKLDCVRKAVEHLVLARSRVSRKERRHERKTIRFLRKR